MNAANVACSYWKLVRVLNVSRCTLNLNWNQSWTYSGSLVHHPVVHFILIALLYTKSMLIFMQYFEFKYIFIAHIWFLNSSGS